MYIRYRDVEIRGTDVLHLAIGVMCSLSLVLGLALLNPVQSPSAPQQLDMVATEVEQQAELSTN